MLAWIAAFAVAGSGPSSGETIDVFRASGNAREVLARLSEKSGLTLLASREAANEPLFIAVKDVVLSDLLEKIGEASMGEWLVGADGTRTLTLIPFEKRMHRHEQTRRDALVRSQKSEAAVPVLSEFEARMLALDAEIAHLLGTHLEYGFELSEASSRLVQERPLMRLAKRLTRSFPVHLAEGPRGTQTLFSTAPTRTHNRLWREGLDAIRLFEEEQCRFAKAVRKAGVSHLASGLNRSHELLGWFEPWKLPSESERDNLARVQVSVTQSGDYLSLHVTVFDSTGRIVGRQADVLAHRIRQVTEASSRLLKNPLQQVNLSEPALELLRAINQGGTTGKPIDPAKEPLRTRLLNPERFDPLLETLPTLFWGLADAEDLDVVACPRDSMLNLPLRLSKTGTTSIEAWWKQLALGPQPQARLVGNWLVSSPLNYLSGADTPERRIDRVDLGAWLRTIDDLGVYVPPKAWTWERFIFHPFMRLSIPFFAARVGGSVENGLEEMLPFLTTNQSDKLKRGETIRVRDLMPLQRESLEEAFVTGRLFSSPHSQTRFNFGREPENLDEDFAFRYRDGLPLEARIRLTQSPTPMILVRGVLEGEPYEWFVTLAELASLVKSQGGKQTPQTLQLSLFQHFHVIRTRLLITLEEGWDFEAKWQVARRMQREAGPFEALPQDVKAAYSAALDRIGGQAIKSCNQVSRR